MEICAEKQKRECVWVMKEGEKHSLLRSGQSQQLNQAPKTTKMKNVFENALSV